MNKRQVLGEDMLGRVKQYFIDHPLATPIARATELITDVNNLHTEVQAFGADQIGGQGGYRAGASERQFLSRQIQTALMRIAATARGLDPELYPGMSDQFRATQATRSYQMLINTGVSFLDALEVPTVKALFTERGFDADFDVQLEAKLTAFAAATGRKASGRQTQKFGTASLAIRERKIAKVMAELRALMVNVLSETDPALVEVWNAAARSYTGSKASPATPAVTAPESAPTGS